MRRHDPLAEAGAPRGERRHHERYQIFPDLAGFDRLLQAAGAPPLPGEAP